jgi:hypothetical protein
MCVSRIYLPDKSAEVGVGVTRISSDAAGGPVPNGASRSVGDEPARASSRPHEDDQRRARAMVDHMIDELDEGSELKTRAVPIEDRPTARALVDHAKSSAMLVVGSRGRCGSAGRGPGVGQPTLRPSRHMSGDDHPDLNRVGRRQHHSVQVEPAHVGRASTIPEAPRSGSCSRRLGHTHSAAHLTGVPTPRRTRAWVASRTSPPAASPPYRQRSPLDLVGLHG